MSRNGGNHFFLGIELAVDQLRASLVDETLDLVGVECVDFDTELSEYKTHGGIFTTPGEAYTTPVEMWVKAIDLLLEKMHQNYDLSKIKAIGGCAQHALVWWKSTTVPSFSSLDPHLPFHHHFPAHVFSLPNVAVAQDTSSHPHAMAIEALLGGPDHMAARVGLCGDSSILSAQLLRVRETWPAEVWNRTGRIQLACNFIGTLLMGKWMNMSETEAAVTGMWNHHPPQQGAGAGIQPQGQWDEGVLDIVGGSREEGRRVRGWLGEVDTTGGGRKVGHVSRYMVDRYGFDPEAIVIPFTTDSIASYLSLIPSHNDAVLAFGPMDQLLTPAQHWLPTRLYTLYPHPAQDPSEKRRYIAALTSRNADVPRALVRDMYTKSWSAFDRLVAIVPPGGSIGLDDKLFSFWHLQSSAYPFSHVKGIYRFETGIKVNEFRDLRANPRCLIESQVLSFRVRWSRMVGTGVLGTAPNSSNNPTTNAASSNTMSPTSRPGQPSSPSPTSRPTSSHSHHPPSLSELRQQQSPQYYSASLGLPFNPYTATSPPLPARLLTTGATANFPSITALLADIWCCGVYLSGTQLDSAVIGNTPNAGNSLSPEGAVTIGGGAHRNAPAEGHPSRASLGGSYLARWVYSREISASSPSTGRGGGTAAPLTSASSNVGTFEDEMKKLMKARWAATGGVPAKTNVKERASVLSQVLAMTPTSTGTGGAVSPVGGGSGRNTPGLRSGLGHEVFVEEEEEEYEDEFNSSLSTSHFQSNSGHLRPPGLVIPGSQAPIMSPPRGYGGNTTPTGGSAYDPIMGMPMNGMTGGTSGGRIQPQIDLSLGPMPLAAYPPPLNTQSASPTPLTQNQPSAAALASENGASAGTPAPTPLLPPVPLETIESEVMMGLAKVGEPDLDAFLGYAAIVPEYCRLEAMLVKGVVL